MQGLGVAVKTEIKAVLAAVTFATLLLSAPAAVVAKSTGGPTVCDTGATGTLPPGSYQSIVVPAGDTCNLGVGPVTVQGGVRVGPGSTFMLGYELGPDTGTISGGITAYNAAQVQVHNAQINGGVSIEGGAGPFASGCPLLEGPSGPPICFNDFEDNSINGAVTINGYNGIWLGFIRNHDRGTVTISNNNQQFDQIDIGSNVVHGNLICFNNTPLENTGESPGGPSSVTGQDTCYGT